MIVAAAVCPAPPVLAAPLTGRDPVVPDLRAACAEAVRRLVQATPDLIAVVGAAAPTRVHDPAARLDLSVFAPALGAGRARATGDPVGDPALPSSLGLGALLLDQAGYSGHRLLQAVSEDEPAARCAELGVVIARAGARVGLLAMADGSARRGDQAPGAYDERAAAFDAHVQGALCAGDLGALLSISDDLARDLMATGRPAWQVLAGAMRPARPRTDILYAADPFGVAYVVAVYDP